MSDFRPRPKQQEVLNYRGGWMGVAAVPGAGKTMTLSALAAKPLTEIPLEDDQEVLIVTMVTSAVGNFSRQIRRLMKGRGFIAGYSYRVRTLHGLCNDIVRERPELVGLGDNFTILDERESNEILQNAVDAWMRGNPDVMMAYVDDEHAEKKYVQTQQLPNLVATMANNIIRQAKDWTWTPAQLREALTASGQDLPLAAACADIYERYQQGLNYRGAVDFQDLIRLALKALQDDPDYLARLRHRWVYILEDEAQDSDQLQERILRMLAGPDGNWVRVGDPNQAIYETFTTANPKYLREFIASAEVQGRELPNSGRSQPSIIRLANQLIDWSLRHPNSDVRARKPLSPPYIEPVHEPDDPQRNPPDNPEGIFIHGEGFAPGEEIGVVVRSVKKWLEENPDLTAAILVPRNARGYETVTALKEAGVPYVEMLRSTTATREVAGSIYHVLAYLANPTGELLARLYRVLRRDEKEDAEAIRQITGVAKLLKGCTQIETFIHPQGVDWLDEVAANDPDLWTHLDAFRQRVRVLQAAAALPVDQLVLTIAQEVFHDEADLAVAYSLSLRLRRDGIFQEQNRMFGHFEQRWGLMEYAERLAEIAKNERKFLGMSEDETGFDPDQHRGKVAVATMHSAKGLEWDRVYLMSVNNYDFPSAELHDSFMGERWFIAGELNLEAEALAQLAALKEGTAYKPGQATRAARIDYVAERLRLLYVGITRARRELVMTWNNGKRGDMREATPMIALRTYLEEKAR